jgi:hypothetical protein
MFPMRVKFEIAALPERRVGARHLCRFNVRTRAKRRTRKRRERRAPGSWPVQFLRSWGFAMHRSRGWLARMAVPDSTFIH